MSARTVTIRLPAETLDRIKRQAASSKRSLPEELTQLVVGAVPTPDELPDDIQSAFQSLTLLRDDDLWRAAKAILPRRVSNRLSRLNSKCQREGLSPAESRERESLVEQYDRHVLIRARAAALLKQRGFDVSALVAS